MSQEPFVVVARVVKTHGLKGEVSVAPVAEAPFSLLAGLEAWFTPPPAGVRVSRVDAVRRGPKGPLVTFENVDSITTAQCLVGAHVLVRSEAVPTGWFDQPEPEGFEGYSVTDAEHGSLGVIAETIVTGANDVWVVHGPAGEVLIPVIDEVVIAVDDDAATVEVRLLEGLLPETGEHA